MLLCLPLLYVDAAHLRIGVPENYDGIFPWYLTKVSSSIKGQTDTVALNEQTTVYSL